MDDDEATRLSMRAALDLVADQRHYTMAEAATGQEALDLLRMRRAYQRHLADGALPAHHAQRIRRGHKKAIVALAHALIVVISHVIACSQPSLA